MRVANVLGCLTGLPVSIGIKFHLLLMRFDWHTTHRNLVKIDLLNGTSSFRFLYVGICGSNNLVQSFHLIQSDTGLINPTPITMVELAPVNWISILVDLSTYPDHPVHIFFYNFDLAEVFDIQPTSANPQLLQGTIPDLTRSSNPTPQSHTYSWFDDHTTHQSPR